MAQELNDKRQGMIARLKVAEREKDALEGKKREAEDFLDKSAELLRHKICGTCVHALQSQVRGAQTATVYYAVCSVLAPALATQAGAAYAPQPQQRVSAVLAHYVCRLRRRPARR